MEEVEGEAPGGGAGTGAKRDGCLPWPGASRGSGEIVHG